MVAAAEAAIATTSLSASGEVAEVLARLIAAAQELAEIVRGAPDWERRTVAVLRDVAGAWERLRELGVPLPPAPKIILALLTCE